MICPVEFTREINKPSRREAMGANRSKGRRWLIHFLHSSAAQLSGCYVQHDLPALMRRTFKHLVRVASFFQWEHSPQGP
jgi:hypothetical protein